MALGAGNSHIAGLVLSQGAQMVGLGVALGFVLVYSVMRYISSLLFGIVPLDPMTLVGVAALVFALALLAAYLPAPFPLGVALGFVLVYSVMRYISSLLFGIVPLDPMTLVGVAALVFALALLAAYLPARRAMRVDPIEALRQG